MADQALKILAPNKTFHLSSLAKRIDAAHVAVQAAVKAGVQRAVEAGQLLIQAKAQVSHGKWEKWVAETTAVSPRSASAYMRIARHWTEADDANRQRVADLSLRAWLAELAGPSFQLASHRAQSDDVTSIVESKAAQSKEEPKTPVVPLVRVPGEDSERTGGSDQSQIAATMKIVREAEDRSAAPRGSRFNKSERLEIRRSLNLDAAKRAYRSLDKADQQEFRNWIAEGASATAKIIDVTT